MSWDTSTFNKIAGVREIHVLVPAPGRAPVRAPIWVVAVDDSLYVRSWKGDGGRWYRRARRYGAGTIVAKGGEYQVRFVPTGDSDLETAIDKQYLAKYADSRFARAMTRPPAAGTTLRLDPAA